LEVKFAHCFKSWFNLDTGSLMHIWFIQLVGANIFPINHEVRVVLAYL